ncbi:MAG: acyl-CoA thioesterase [Deltaproteobacteria bacterium]|nr:MAG: acyl-CoA thioesterase [Deltaproteobacteria bacterium]
MRLHPTSVRLTVPFHDCDPLGVVWHGHYFKYLELARTEILAPRGLDGAELLATGHRLYVVDARCRYAAPLRYRDAVRVDAWVTEIDPRITLRYEIHNETTGERSARASTSLAITDADGRLLLATPPILLDRIQGHVPS